jgi:hypothetical protein
VVAEADVVLGLEFDGEELDEQAAVANRSAAEKAAMPARLIAGGICRMAGEVSGADRFWTTRRCDVRGSAVRPEPE